MATYVKRSAEERKAAANEIHDKLASQVAALRTSDEWKRFLAFAGSFHNYSLNNVMLILVQYPNATRVAGFQQWLKKDPARSVKKGSKAIKIFGFAQKKIEAEDENGVIVEGKRTYFPILNVFDISQTDPVCTFCRRAVHLDDDGNWIGNSGSRECPENASGHDVAAMAEPSAPLTGEGPDGVFDALSVYLEGKGWAISMEPISGAANGYTTTDGSKRIVISDELDPAAATKTLLHEGAHATLHAGTEGISPEDYRQHRGVYECEAESVAYVLAGLVGFDTSAYSVGYVTGWTDDDKILKETAGNVMRAVHILAPVILGEDTDED
jgi:hypothetical protein